MTTKPDFTKLFDIAIKARDNASAKYSKFKVGAAILTKSGNIYSGSNVESSSYGLSICAERVALFTALTNGEKEFDSILLVSDSSSPTSPCGACRQVLYDYAPNINVIMSNLNKDEVVENIKNLLIKPFSLDK
ncbi:MAG: cytidine deaminase [Candidatus Delongbacteria bacterium]|jgi:cytidine deaminase|nr:cytidine deaminase [Candidatus Delongbacteria bacterium]